MTGPVIRIDDSQPVVLSRSRWRTASPGRRPTGWATNEHERCQSSCGTRRCMLRGGHIGLHAWPSLGELRIFEWG